MLQLIDPAVAILPGQDIPLGEPWQCVQHCRTLHAAVEQIAEIYEFQWHPYFIWARSAKVDRRAFIRSQLPFQSTVGHFTQALHSVFDRAELAGPEVNRSSAQPIVTPTHPPQQAFQNCLQSLDSNVHELSSCPIEIAAANHRILSHCRMQPVELGAAMLGMIEYLYVDITATLSQIIQQRGWAGTDSNFHYSIHDVLGVDPSRDLLTFAHDAWNHPASRPQVVQSLALGAQCLWEIYDGLYPDQAPVDAA